MQRDENQRVSNTDKEAAAGQVSVKIQTEQIMDDIRKEIEQQGYHEELLHFREVDLETDIAKQECYDPEYFENAVANMNVYYKIPTEYNGHSNPVKRLFQKIVVKLISFYMEPIAEAQTRYNVESTHAMNQIRLFHLQMESDLEELNITERSSSYDLIRTIREMENKMTQMQQELDDTKKELHRLQGITENEAAAPSVSGEQKGMDIS